MVTKLLRNTGYSQTIIHLLCFINLKSVIHGHWTFWRKEIILPTCWLVTLLLQSCPLRSQAKWGKFAAPIRIFHKFFPAVLGKPFRLALPIVPETACLFRCIDRKRKYVLYKTTANLKNPNNAQRYDTRPIPNDWHYFGPTLVFAGDYL